MQDPALPIYISIPTKETSRPFVYLAPRMIPMAFSPPSKSKILELLLLFSSMALISWTALFWTCNSPILGYLWHNPKPINLALFSYLIAAFFIKLVTGIIGIFKYYEYAIVSPICVLIPFVLDVLSLIPIMYFWDIEFINFKTMLFVSEGIHGIVAAFYFLYNPHS